VSFGYQVFCVKAKKEENALLFTTLAGPKTARKRHGLKRQGSRTSSHHRDVTKSVNTIAWARVESKKSLEEGTFESTGRRSMKVMSRPLLVSSVSTNFSYFLLPFWQRLKGAIRSRSRCSPFPQEVTHAGAPRTSALRINAQY